MSLQKSCRIAAVGLALCWISSAVADDYHFSGLANDGLWSSPNNWTNTTTPGTGVPAGPGNAVFVDAANGWSVITITNTDNLLVPDMVFGPEWGATLNIYGKVQCGWYMAPVQTDSANPSIINMYSNSTFTAEGIGLGDNWWWHGGPWVTMNMHGDAFVGINWMFWGGRLNLYDNSVFSITNGLTVDTANVSDASRAINLAGGTLVLPASFTATVNDWIARGILLTYGLPSDGSEISIDEANTNWPGRTVVTSVSLGPILAIRVNLSRTNLLPGALVQAHVLADYASKTDVDVTGVEGVAITYQSSATTVATVGTNGLVRAVGLGNASISATVGSLSNSISLTVSKDTSTAALIHRYSFSEASDAYVASDSVGGASWDAYLIGGATLGGGQLTLDGESGYLMLQPGIVSGLDAVTVEAWVSFSTISNWACLYAFGDTDSGTGFGRNYITCQPHTFFNTMQIGISDANPGNTHEQDAWRDGVLDNRTNLHVVAVYHPLAGYTAMYTNGMLAAINTNISITLTDAVAADPLNYIGKSLYNSDPYLNAGVDEFRIYDGPLTPGQIAADHALGAEQFIGSNTNVTLNAWNSGSMILLSWPTNSALVDAMWSPTLGAGARWNHATGTMTINGNNYQMAIPAGSSAAFFRLQK